MGGKTSTQKNYNTSEKSSLIFGGIFYASSVSSIHVRPAAA